MFYYIDQSLTPALLIGLVKTKSDVIVRSVETDLGRLTLVVAVISVDAYLFGGFLSFWGMLIFLGDPALSWLIVRRTNLEVATKRLVHQQVKILG